MAGKDENTYGFIKADADALVSMIGLGETETPGRRIGGSGGGGDELFNFSLLADMASNQALAAIYELDGASIGSTIGEHIVFDPVGIFSSLIDAQNGLCIRRKGKFYIIQAACP